MAVSILFSLTGSGATAQKGPPGSLGFWIAATDFYVEPMSLRCGRPFIAETGNLSPGADTVIHLFRYQSPAGYQQVAFNDEWGTGLRSRISYTPPCGGLDSYLLVVRAKYGHTGGTADLLTATRTSQPVLHEATIPVGGQFIPLVGVDVPIDSARRYEAVEVPGGATQIWVFALGAAGNALRTSATTPSVGGGSYLMGHASMTALFIGAPRFRAPGGGLEPSQSGQARLFVNDIASDTDGDGAGDELEEVLLTCAEPAGAINCEGVFNSRDTDRDGIEDGAEIFGVETGGAPEDDIRLPRWGANPRHKDLFAEIDFGYPFDVSPFGPAGSQDPNTWFEEIAALYAVGDATLLGNPDGMNGVALHFDLGVNPDPARVDLYGGFGDWSGSEDLRGISYAQFVDIDTVAGGVFTLTIGAQSFQFLRRGTVTPVGVANVLARLVNQPRTGSYLATATVISNSDGTATIRLDAIENVVNFIVTISGPAGSSTALRVENADEVRERAYFDPLQFDPARATFLRYGHVQDRQTGQAAGRRFHANLGRNAFSHELGHTVGLEHHQHDDSMPGSPNCVPHYISLMSYSYVADLTVGFVAVGSDLSLNPSRANEVGALDGQPTALLGGSPFFRTVSGLDVDWNFDLGYSTRPVRGVVFAAPADSCDTFTHERQDVAPDVETSGAPTLVTTESRIYAMYSDAREVPYYSFGAITGADDNGSCPGGDSAGATCVAWSAPTTLPLLQSASGLSAVFDGTNIFVAYRTRQSRLRVARLRVDPGGFLGLVSDDNLTALNSQWVTERTPEIAILHTDPASEIGGPTRLAVFALDSATRAFRWGSYSSTSGRWTDRGLVLDPSGAPVVGGGSPTVIPWPDRFRDAPFDASDRTACGVFPDTNGAIRFYCLQPRSLRWTDLTAQFWGPSATDCATAPPICDDGLTCVFGECIPTTRVKTGLAFHYLRSADGTSTAPVRMPGYLQLGYVLLGGNIPRMAISQVLDSVNGPMTGTVPIVTRQYWIGNEWVIPRPFSGIDFEEHRFLSATKAIWSRSDVRETGVQFLPLADGSPDYETHVHSDFSVMEDELCSFLRPGPLVEAYCGSADLEAP